MADNIQSLKVILEMQAKGIQGLNKGINKLNKNLQSTEQSTGKLNKGMDRFQRRDKGVAQAGMNTTKSFSKMQQTMDGGGGSGGLVRAYALLAANVFAVTAAFGVLQRAAAVDKLTESMEILSTRGGQDIENLSQKLKEASGNAVALDAAFRQVSLASSAGLSTEEIEGLTTVAKGAAISLGRDLPDALDRIFRGAIKLEPEILDEIGLFVRVDEAAKKYAQQLGRTVTSLSQADKRQAFLNEILDQGITKFEEYAEAVEPDAFTQLAAALADISITMTKFVTGALSPFVKFMAETPIVLGAVFGLIATSLLGKAVPAVGQFLLGTEMAAAAAAEDAIEYVNGVNNKANAAIQASINEKTQRLSDLDDIAKAEVNKNKVVFRSQSARAKDNKKALADTQKAGVGTIAQRKAREAAVKERIEILKIAKKNKNTSEASVKLIDKELRLFQKEERTLRKMRTTKDEIAKLNKEGLSVDQMRDSIAKRRIDRLERRALQSGAISSAVGATEVAEGGFFAAIAAGNAALDKEFADVEDKLGKTGKKTKGVFSKTFKGIGDAGFKLKGRLAVLATAFQGLMASAGPYLLLATALIAVATGLFKAFASGQEEAKKLNETNKALNKTLETTEERFKKQIAVAKDSNKTFQENIKGTLAFLTGQKELATNVLKARNELREFNKEANFLMITWQGLKAIVGQDIWRQTRLSTQAAFGELVMGTARLGDSELLNVLLEGQESAGFFALALSRVATGEERIAEIRARAAEVSQEALDGVNEAIELGGRRNEQQLTALIGAQEDLGTVTGDLNAEALRLGNTYMLAKLKLAGYNLDINKGEEAIAKYNEIIKVQEARLRSFISAVSGADEAIGKFQQSFLPRTKVDEILGSIVGIQESFEALQKEIDVTFDFEDVDGNVKQLSASFQKGFTSDQMTQFLERFSEEDNPLRKIFSDEEVARIEELAKTNLGEAGQVIQNTIDEFSQFQFTLLNAKVEMKSLNKEIKLFEKGIKMGAQAGQQVARLQVEVAKQQLALAETNFTMLVKSFDISKAQALAAIQTLEKYETEKEIRKELAKFDVSTIEAMAIRAAFEEQVTAMLQLRVQEEAKQDIANQRNIQALKVQLAAERKRMKAKQELVALDNQLNNRGLSETTSQRVERELRAKKEEATMVDKEQRAEKALQISAANIQIIEMKIMDRKENLLKLQLRALELEDKIASTPEKVTVKTRMLNSLGFYSTVESEQDNPELERLKGERQGIVDEIDSIFTEGVETGVTNGLIAGINNTTDDLVDAFEKIAQKSGKEFQVAIQDAIKGVATETDIPEGIRTLLGVEKVRQERIKELETQRDKLDPEKDKNRIDAINLEIEALGKLNHAYLGITSTIRMFATQMAELGPEGVLASSVLMGLTNIGDAFMTMGSRIGEITNQMVNEDGSFKDGFDQATFSMAKGAEVAAFVGNALAQVNSMMAANSSRQIGELDKQIAAEKKRDGKSKESLARIQAMEKKKEAMERKRFNQNKKMMIAQTIANTAAGIMQVMSAPGDPFKVFGIPMAAVIGALGAAQVAIIARQKYEGGGSETPKAQIQKLEIGKRSENVDVAQRATAGELNYLRGGRTTGQDLGGAGGAMGRRGYGMGIRGYAMGDDSIVVGERGPEVITPASPVDITPNFALGGETNVNFSINAIDAAGVEDVLMNQQGNIIRMIREAANENGERFLENVDTQTYGSNT
jgi:hypothetical protein